MRSIAGPSRTRRPRNANGSMRKGCITSSGAVWLGKFNVGAPPSMLGNNSSPIVITGCPKGGPGNHEDQSLPECPRPYPWLPGSGAPPRPDRLAETPGKNTLLGVQPVLRLVPDDRLRTVYDPGGNLFPTLCRQAVHKDRVGFGVRHQVFVDAVRRQHVVAVDARFNAHRYPGVGDDAIRPG